MCFHSFSSFQGLSRAECAVQYVISVQTTSAAARVKLRNNGYIYCNIRAAAFLQKQSAESS